MARILVYNNDTLYTKRHINYSDEMETFFIAENKVVIGGISDG